MTEPLPSATPRRAALAFIFITVMLDILAMGMITPVLPRLLVSLQDNDTARAAAVFGLFSTVWELMQFLCSPLLGVLSDRFGRRPVILLSNLGLGLDYILMALAPTLGWLFVGRVISGVTSASIATANAYIADVTPPEKRAASFGLLGAAFGVGFIIGPAVGGVLSNINPHLPFWVAAGLSLTNALYGLFVLPESLPPERRMGFQWQRANPIGSLGLLRSHPEVFGLSIVSFLYNLAHVSLPSVFVLYVGYRYGWDERTVGLSLAALGICSMIVQAGLMRPIISRLGERRTMLLGLAFGAAGFAIYGLAPTGFEFCLGIPVIGLWGLFGPASQGIMTSRVSPSEQGQFQGALASVMGVAGTLGPGLFTLLFARAIDTPHAFNLSGAPFLLCSLLLATGLLIAWRATSSRPEDAVAPAPTAGA